MSQVSTVFDALNARLTSLLPEGDGWNRMPLPYMVEANPDLILKKSYGLKFGDAVNKQTTVGNLLGVRRNVSVLISNDIVATELDSETKDDAYKTLLETARSVVRDFERGPSLESVGNCLYQGDSGIQFVDGDEGIYAYIEVRFAVDYFDNLTT